VGFGVDANNLAELTDNHEFAGLVDDVNAGDLADRKRSSRPNSQNGNPSKINPGKVACFSSPNPDHQLPSFYQQSTTTSPPKHHVQPPVFAKTPSKNKVPPAQKITAEAPLFEQDFGFFGGMTTAATLYWVFEVADPGAAPTRANSPTTENAPGMSQNPSAQSFSRKRSFA
jgi:hypothetical protein